MVEIHKRLCRATAIALFSLLFILAGCTFEGQPKSMPTVPQLIVGINPTMVDIAATITPSPTASQIPPAVRPDTPVPSVTAVAESTEPEPEATPTLANTRTPTPVTGGIRPNQASFVRPPELGPESPVEWRPPPVSVPHALHPDDHYWLARPLPSDSRNYDLEYYPYGNAPVLVSLRPYRVHHGMDFPNDKGTPIFAASSGTVVFAGPRTNPFNGINYYGNTVIILHDWQLNGQDVYTLYAHTLELFVEAGDFVEQGQLIAGVGDSGEVSGPHLHLEVRVGTNHYDSTRNPGLWLAPFEGWGTLAGRFVDNRGRAIHGAHITLRPLSVESEVDVPVRRYLTYAPSGINGDDSWNENFAFSDLPAGEYRIEFRTAGRVFEREVVVKPEMTNFIIVQADITWQPTAVPTSTPTTLPTVTPTGSGTPEGTAAPGS